VPGFAPLAPQRHHRVGDELLRGELLRADGLVVGRDAPLASALQLSIVAGGCLGITGPNGSGKSTLALTLGGLIPALAGTLTPDPLRWRSRELVTRIGSVFQDPEHQFVAATVLAELRVGAKAIGLSATETASRVDALLSRLRLDALADANPFTLSGGEKRRLSVATALVTRPPLLVLDEPTFGQDARTWAELAAFLADLLDDGSAVVAITHDSALVSALADSELRIATRVAA
jgi:energy-coupling factor transport system ATP-binding protein